MQVKKQQLEPDMEEQTASKLRKEYVKAVYCHPAGVQPWLIQGIRSRDGVGEGQDTIASIRY